MTDKFNQQRADLDKRIREFLLEHPGSGLLEISAELDASPTDVIACLQRMETEGTATQHVLSQTPTQPQLDKDFLMQPARDIQKSLAAQYRQRTGNKPRGQLWEPCSLSECDNEPVCMNCMCCQDTHCDCFD